MPPNKSNIKLITTHQLQEMKNRGEKISMLTAYDYSIAGIRGNTPRSIESAFVESRLAKVWDEGAVVGEYLRSAPVFNRYYPAIVVNADTNWNCELTISHTGGTESEEELGAVGSDTQINWAKQTEKNC